MVYGKTAISKGFSTPGHQASVMGVADPGPVEVVGEIGDFFSLHPDTNYRILL
jgi:hypothetical protein